MLKRSEFIKKFYPLAKSGVGTSTVQPYLSLAVAAVESRNGNSLLSTKYKNYHGIKAQKGYKGKAVLMQTREEKKNGEIVVLKDRFRVYNSPAESFKDFTKFLQTNTRYRQAIALPTAHLQAQGLQSAGYATSSQYATTLQGVISQIKTILGSSPAASFNADLLTLSAAGLLLFLIPIENGRNNRLAV